jgi:hypothetical protein
MLNALAMLTVFGIQVVLLAPRWLIAMTLVRVRVFQLQGDLAPTSQQLPCPTAVVAHISSKHLRRAVRNLCRQHHV